MHLVRLGALGALALILPAAALAGDCSETYSNDAIDEQLDEAMLAFASLDEAGFLTAATRSAVMVPCAEEMVTPSLAAAYHRVHAVRFFVSGQEPEARDSLRAAFGIDAEATLSTRIAPEGGKLYRMQEEALGDRARPSRNLEIPDGYEMAVDGRNGNRVPADAPHIVQLLEGSRPAWSGVLPPGGALPPEFSATVADLEPIDLGGPADSGIADLDEPDRGREPRAPKERSGDGPNKGLLGAAAVAGLGAVGLYGIAAASRLSFDNNPTAGKFHLTNGAYWGSVGLGGTAIVLGGASFLGGGRR